MTAPKSARFALETYKFGTTVVLVTTNGAVPVAMFDINCGAVILAVANTCAVLILPILALPVTFKLLPRLAIPVILAVPEILAPVPVTVKIAALPATPTVTLPPDVAILTLDVPLLILAPPPTAIQLSVPEPSVLNTYPLVPPEICRFATAPNVTLAVVAKLTIADALFTVKPVNDPSEVIFGWADEVDVSTPPKKFALTKLAPDILPPVPTPADKLPVTSKFPTTFAPVPVTTKTLAFPAALILTLPLALGMLTLELPLA